LLAERSRAAFDRGCALENRTRPKFRPGFQSQLPVMVNAQKTLA
jgi:hypothetical protein